MLTKKELIHYIDHLDLYISYVCKLVRWCSNLRWNILPSLHFYFVVVPFLVQKQLLHKFETDRPRVPSTRPNKPKSFHRTGPSSGITCSQSMKIEFTWYWQVCESTGAYRAGESDVGFWEIFVWLAANMEMTKSFLKIDAHVTCGHTSRTPND